MIKISNSIIRLVLNRLGKTPKESIPIIETPQGESRTRITEYMLRNDNGDMLFVSYNYDEVLGFAQGYYQINPGDLYIKKIVINIIDSSEEYINRLIVDE